MKYLAHSGHAQLGALGVSCVGWMLTGVALGLIQWRVWLVSDRDAISSGVAWVGVWRACFNSHTHVTPGFQVMHCKPIGLTEAFTPPEIVAGQVLMLLSLLAGLSGNAGAVYSLRNVYFGVQRSSSVRAAFVSTGALCLLAAATSLVPLMWNLSSVATNQTIKFPPEFRMPSAPESQYAGWGIRLGTLGAVLMAVSGVIFCTYRLPARSPVTDGEGADNPAFESHEHL
ncbi:claudin-34-like [Clinocottus analis]|uniref:claudin-34-like n=1 Tax=Clinocottus analis TaxID=304258 RepID=UPI0035C003C3